MFMQHAKWEKEVVVVIISEGAEPA